MRLGKGLPRSHYLSVRNALETGSHIPAGRTAGGTRRDSAYRLPTRKADRLINAGRLQGTGGPFWKGATGTVFPCVRILPDGSRESYLSPREKAKRTRRDKTEPERPQVALCVRCKLPAILSLLRWTGEGEDRVCLACHKATDGAEGD